MRISDWSSDVCSSDLPHLRKEDAVGAGVAGRHGLLRQQSAAGVDDRRRPPGLVPREGLGERRLQRRDLAAGPGGSRRHALADRLQRTPRVCDEVDSRLVRSEERTSELQSLMRISYAGFRLRRQTTTKKKSEEPQTRTPTAPATQNR